MLMLIQRHLKDINKQGYTYRLPVDFTVTSKLSNAYMPTVDVRSESKLSANALPIKLANGTAGRLASRLMPKVYLSARVLNTSMTIGVALDVAIRLEVSRAELAACRGTGLGLYTRSLLMGYVMEGRAYVAKPKTLWRHKSPVLCIYTRVTPSRDFDAVENAGIDELD